MLVAQELKVTHGAKAAQEAKVTRLLSKDLPDVPGKQGLMFTVEYPPGASDPVHRHNAGAFVYVIEGSIVMQVRGGKQETLTPGQTFYEGPNDVHIVGRNESDTKPAKFLVFMVKDEGAPIMVPAKLTGEITSKQNTRQRKLRMRVWLRATRGQWWLHIGALCNWMAWVDMEVEC